MVRHIPTGRKVVVKHPKQRRHASDGTRWQLRRPGGPGAAQLGEFSRELRQALRGLGDHQTSPTEQRQTTERRESSNFKIEPMDFRATVVWVAEVGIEDVGCTLEVYVVEFVGGRAV
jgi:hypothetical protein